MKPQHFFHRRHHPKFVHIHLLEFAVITKGDGAHGSFPLSAMVCLNNKSLFLLQNWSIFFDRVVQTPLSEITTTFLLDMLAEVLLSTFALIGYHMRSFSLSEAACTQV